MALGVVSMLLAGCGGGSGEETTEKAPDRPLTMREFSITLDGYASAETMGIVMANELGYFEDVGLDVAIFPPLNPVRPVLYAATGEADVTISHQPQVVLARERDVPIIAVASLVSQPTAAMIWLKKSGIEDIADLKGKTIAIPGLSFQRAFLQSILARAGLTLADVKVKRVDYELVPALTSGRADAIFGGSWNVEGAELEARGLDPVVTRVQSLGVPDYEELVLITDPDRLSKDPQSIRDFISALARGTAAAEKDPRATAEAVLKLSEKGNVEATEAAVEATLPLLSKTGRMSPERADGLVAWMREEDLIQKPLSAADLFTNDYLPSE